MRSKPAAHDRVNPRLQFWIIRVVLPLVAIATVLVCLYIGGDSPFPLGGGPGQFGLREAEARTRSLAHQPQVVILSVQDDETGKVAALDGGADDYVTKPFHASELLARLRVALRHATKPEETAVFQVGDLVADLASRRITVKGREVKLTATEYNLLRFFVRHAGKVLTHRQLLREVWGPGHEEHTHYLRVYVTRLREKLGCGMPGMNLLRTEPGVGYRLVVSDS